MRCRMDYVRHTTESAKFMDKGAECISALGAFGLGLELSIC